MVELTLEEKRERVMALRPIDDVFFEVLARNPEVDEEILQTILEDRQLKVTEVIVQQSERNLYGKSVRLDALCTLGDGTKCNIEVQRFENDNHLKRARYNASSITVNESQTGALYEDVINVIIVYISEFDFLKGKKTIYHIDKVVRETNEVIDDGLREVFVNTCVDDGSDIAELMRCFIQRYVDNPKFPKLSNEVQELKMTEGGLSAMSEVLEKYIEEGRIEGLAQGKAEGLKQGREEGLAQGKAAGLKQGREEGLTEGRRLTLFGLVRDGIMTAEKAAEQLEVEASFFEMEYQSYLNNQKKF